MRPALAALAAQQVEIDRLKGVVAFIADAAGLSNHPHVASLMKGAADENPAQPTGWAISSPEAPGSEAPAQTSADALAPSQGKDDPESVGEAPNNDVKADATTSLDSTETVLDTPLDLNEQDPTKPVAGTDTLGEGERGQGGSGRTETEVRVGQPSDTGAAFPETGWTTSSKEGRQFASLRLARLRMQAGIEEGRDDLSVGATIAASEQTDEAIQTEIETLSKVMRASASREPVEAPRHLVPRAAAQQPQRTTPSFRQEGAPVPMQTIASAPSDDEFAFE